MPTISDARQRAAARLLCAIRLSRGQSVLWIGEVLRTSDAEEDRLGADFIEMQIPRRDIAKIFEVGRRTYPAYHIGRPDQGPTMILSFNPEDPPVLLVIDQPDAGAFLRKEAWQRDRWRQMQQLHKSLAHIR